MVSCHPGQKDPFGLSLDGSQNLVFAGAGLATRIGMQNPMAGRLAESKDFSLDKYVVGKTMDGLFYMIGEEEKKIRKDPAAQTTALLREIFGKKQ